MKLSNTIFMMVLFTFSSTIFAETMDVNIGNPRVEDGVFKFEVQFKRTDNWVNGFGQIGGLGDSDFYFNYNSEGFSGIPSLTAINSNITDNASDYSILVQINGGKLQVKIEYTPVSFAWNPTIDVFVDLCTVNFSVQDPNQNSGITWDQTNSGFNDGDGDIIVPNYNSSGDISLPVSLTGFTVEALKNKISLNWATQSEINNAGFEIYRSIAEDGEYEMIAGYQNNPMLEGQGNTNTEHEYNYTDNVVVAGQTYWYKLADIDFAGVKTFHQPISATLTVDGNGISSTSPDMPKAFKLYPNFPNPFNPETVLRFDIPQISDGNSQTQIFIHNSLGQLVRKLYSGSLTAGTFEIKWDGKTGFGNVLPSGFYFATLNVGNYYSDTIKMLLVR